MVGSNGELELGALAEVDPGAGSTPVQAATMPAIRASIVAAVMDVFGVFGFGRIFIGVPPHESSIPSVMWTGSSAPSPVIAGSVW